MDLVAMNKFVSYIDEKLWQVFEYWYVTCRN